MTSGDEMDAELTRRHHRRLGRLPGQVEVVALCGRIRHVPGSAAGDNCHALDGGRSLAENERVGAEAAADLADERLDRKRRSQPASYADPGELALDLDAELAGEQGVVADLRVRIEREVVRGERDVGVEQRFQP